MSQTQEPSEGVSLWDKLFDEVMATSQSRYIAGDKMQKHFVNMTDDNELGVTYVSDGYDLIKFCLTVISTAHFLTLYNCSNDIIFSQKCCSCQFFESNSELNTNTTYFEFRLIIIVSNGADACFFQQFSGHFMGGDDYDQSVCHIKFNGSLEVKFDRNSNAVLEYHVLKISKNGCLDGGYIDVIYNTELYVTNDICFDKCRLLLQTFENILKYHFDGVALLSDIFLTLLASVLHHSS